MLLSTLSFAVVNALIKTLGHLPAFEKVFFRCLVSLVISIGYLRKIKVNLLGNNRRYLLLRGLAGSIALTLFFIVIERIPLASAVTIQYLSPIFTAIFGLYMLREKVSVPQWVFFLISFLGVVIMKGFDHRIDNFSLGLGILSACLSGIAYNCIRKCKDTDHPVVIVLYFPLVATPLLSLFIYLFHFGPFAGEFPMKVWETPQGWDWTVLLIIGLFTQLAQVSMTKALHLDNAAPVTNMKYLGSVFALMIGFFFFNESFQIMALLGIATVLLGVLLNVTYKEKVKKTP